MAHDIRTPREKARAFLLVQADACTNPTGRLATLNALARACGVSLVTMQRAARDLADQSVLTVVPGGGIFAARVPAAVTRSFVSPRERTTTTSYVWMRVRTLMQEELLGARWPEAPRSITELARHYRVSYATARRAVACLVDRHLLIRSGRGFARPYHGRPSTPGRNRIVVVAATDGMHSLLNATPQSNEFWRMLEETCRKKNLEFSVISFAKAMGREKYPDGRTRTLAQYCDREYVLGIVLLSLGVIGELQRIFLQAALQANKPISIVDEVAQFDAGNLRLFPGARLFPVACTGKEGYPVGQFLRELGHRSYVCIGLYGADPLYLRRMQGVAEGFGVGCRGHQAILFPGLQTTKLEKQMRDDVLSRQLSANVEKLDGEFRAMTGSYSAEEFARSGNYLVRDSFLGTRLAALFTRILYLEEPTVWVAFNDNLALMALSFLRKRGVSVPSRLSLCGFDNVIESLGSSLTTCSFTVPALVEALVDHILLWPGSNRMAGEQVVHIPAYVVERATTAPPCPRSPA